MSETKPIYSGEATLRARGETDKAGRWIRLEIEDFGGVHPFKGYEGERFAVVIVGPLASAEHELPEQTRVGPASGGKSGQGLQKNVSEDSGRSTTKRRWQDMPASQRAALILQHDMFEEFARKFGMGAIGETPEGWLKAKLQIKQKRDLDLDGSQFQRTALAALEGQFMAFCQARGHGVI